MVGKYFSLSEDDKNHYLEFWPDKTYYNVLLNHKDTIVKIQGNWDLLDDQGTLYLTNWTFFDKTGNKTKRPNIISVTVSNQKIIFSGDDEKKNFKKNDQY